MDADRVLAFRFARAGLAQRVAGDPAAGAPVPVSDVAPHAALLALAARVEGLTADGMRRAVDEGRLVTAHLLRGALHALAPGDLALFGPALLAEDDEELGVQLGEQARRVAAAAGLRPSAALGEVAAAVTDALAGGRRLGRDALHAEMRARVRRALMPPCARCGTHHVAPMLWRLATIRAGAVLDSARRYHLRPHVGGADPAEAVRRFLAVYGPATPGDLAAWAGLARPHAARLWDAADHGLAEVRVGRRRGWVRAEDLPALAAPPPARGVRLLPPGDPLLQAPNRPLLVPDPALRARLFRPSGSPGAVTAEGRLAGLWRLRVAGGSGHLTVEHLGPLPRRALEEEAGRIAGLRGAERVVVTEA